MTDLTAAQIKLQARALAAGDAGGRVVATTIGEAMDRRGVPLLRVILAASALLIIYIEPTEPDRNVPMTYGALLLYFLFSAAVYLAEVVWERAMPARTAHWLDVAWHTLLVSLSSGTSSLFFSFYYFDILVASFRCGTSEGLRVTGAAAPGIRRIAVMICAGRRVPDADPDRVVLSHQGQFVPEPFLRSEHGKYIGLENPTSMGGTPAGANPRISDHESCCSGRLTGLLWAHLSLSPAVPLCEC